MSIDKKQDSRKTTDTITIPKYEEQLQVDKKTVESGKVHISKTVKEEEVSVNIPTIEEKVAIKHVPVNQYVETSPAIRNEGDTTIVPVVKEVLVIEKRLMLVEELHITKQKVELNTPYSDKLKKEEINVSHQNLES